MEHVPPRLRDPRAQPLLVAAQSRAVGRTFFVEVALLLLGTRRSRRAPCTRRRRRRGAAAGRTSAAAGRGRCPPRRTPSTRWRSRSPRGTAPSGGRGRRPQTSPGAARAARRPGRNSTRGSTRRARVRLGREAVEVVHRDVVEARPVVPARAARIGERLEGGVHERAAVERESVDLVGGEDVVAHAEPSEDRRQPCAKLGHGSRRAQRHDDRERRRSLASAVPAAAQAGRGAARRWQPPSLWASYHEQPFDSQRNAEAAPATPSAWAAAAMVSPPRVAPLLDASWYSLTQVPARPFRRRTLGGDG